MSAALPHWSEDTCVVCPARKLGPGQFDVLEARARDYRYNRQIGWRVDAAGTAVCVHPYRVALPVGRYASRGTPLPDPATPRPTPSAVALELPEDLLDLEAWLIAVLRTAESENLLDAIAEAERVAGQRFAPGAVIHALRRVLSHELAQLD